MRPEKRRRIARETLEIYAPIAERLGLNDIRLELEDLGFRNMHPLRYRVLHEAVQKARGNRKEIIEKIGETVRERLWQEGLEGKVEGREKHLYSIYRKMREKHLSFHDVFDIYALRIIVESVDECYRTLGVVHNLYKPVPGKFKDYIAIPKANGYQSLHTVLFSPYGVPIEIQIRTRDMNRVANVGVAAHWWYKNREGEATVSGAQQRAREWLRGLLEMQQVAGNSIEFLENVKIDLFPDEVYVFTPKGDIMELPRGATAVDYAYMVHTDVGNSCVAAKIDRRLFPLNTELRNGQTVEIVTAPNARPNPSWLNFVMTAKARSNIRSFLKHMQREESINLGKRLLDKHLSTVGLSCDEVEEEVYQRVLEELDIADRDSLFIEVGLGSRLPQLVARSLVPDLEQAGEAPLNGGSNKPLYISGTEGMVVQFARCCRPIPGDEILGYISTGRGIVIHNKLCKNLGEFRKHSDKWIDLQWENDLEGEFPVDVRVDVANRRGVLATVAASIASMDSNIENVEMEERDGLHTALNLTISVHSRHHLANIMRRVKRLDCVSRIHRRHL
jgi:RelA/SpoT family (p)ppGpp synthetase